MKYSEAVKPISYLKTHASALIRDISAHKKTLIVTHNGEAKVVVQDVKVYEKTQESLALLKILALSAKQVKQEKHNPIDKAFSNVRTRIAKLKKERNEV